MSQQQAHASYLTPDLDVSLWLNACNLSSSTPVHLTKSAASLVKPRHLLSCNITRNSNETVAVYDKTVVGMCAHALSCQAQSSVLTLTIVQFCFYKSVTTGEAPFPALSLL